MCFRKALYPISLKREYIDFMSNVKLDNPKERDPTPFLPTNKWSFECGYLYKYTNSQIPLHETLSLREMRNTQFENKLHLLATLFDSRIFTKMSAKLLTNIKDYFLWDMDNLNVFHRNIVFMKYDWSLINFQSNHKPMS